MIIFNYDAFFKRYDKEIQFYAKRISFEEADDHAQDIRIFIMDHLQKFDPSCSSLKYYVHLIILTAYRRIVFDRKKQRVFEDSFMPLCADVTVESLHDNYEELVSKVVKSLNSEIKTVIFYAVLYNKGEKNYTQIAKLLNMNYSSFLNYMQQIREVVKDVLKENC